jgi:DNA polymerase-1
VANKKKKLVLVDGSALAFRSFYALFTAGMRNAEGTPTWAVFGFLKALFEVLEKHRPDMIAVCFDLATPTFRHVEYEDYKANRDEMPDDLSAQWPIIKEGIEALGVPIYEKAGFEADDIIGTVGRDAEAHNMEVLVLTGDQDAFQLLDKSIQVLMPARQGGGLTIFGRQEVYDKLGVWPEQVPDYKALCGDNSDNIPGVKGIGSKTAAALLNQFPTLEAIYSHLGEIKSVSVRQKLEDGKKSAFSSKGLATIRYDVPLKFDFEHCRLNMPEMENLVDFFRTYEFNSFLKSLPKILAPFNEGSPPNVVPEMLEPVKIRKIRKLGSAEADDAPAANTKSASIAQLKLFDSVGIAELTAAGTDGGEHNQIPQLDLIVSTEERLKRVVKEIMQASAIAVELDTKGTFAHDCSILGYALCWTPAANLDNKNGLNFDKQDMNVHAAYFPNQFPGIKLDTKYKSALGKAIKDILENDSIGKIAHDAKPIINMLSLDEISVKPLVFDTMIASYVADPLEDHGLADQANSILGVELQQVASAKGAARKKKEQEELDLAEYAKCAVERSAVIMQLARDYCLKFDDEQRSLLFNIDLPLVPVLADMEQAGIALDLDYLEEFSVELGTELSRLEREIYKSAGHEFNINSPQQLQKVLFEELKLPFKGRTKSGYSTDAAVLEAIAEEHPIVSKVLEYRQSTKLKSTYVDALPKMVSERDNRIHGEFNQTVASTGRLSSSNPNLQNIPIRTELGRRIRKAIIPGKKSHVLLTADYSQIELRLLAHMSGDELLMEAFRNDEDIHARSAMEIFDVPLEKVTADMRRIGKTLNFALIYQQGVYATAASLGVSSKEAQGYTDKYFARYPSVKGFLSGTIEQARKDGHTTTLWGRRRYFRYLNDANDMIRKAEERAACNAPLQGSAADLMKLAMIRADCDLKTKQLRAQLILQVHDELVFEVPKDEIEETRAVVVEAMSLDQPFKVPLRIDTGVGKNWMETK